jgi:hypothetical protein
MYICEPTADERIIAQNFRIYPYLSKLACKDTKKFAYMQIKANIFAKICVCDFFIVPLHAYLQIVIK